jgi:16S rRNA C967 or C1407 C5-methylase (RsmB/RsmF family)
MSDEAIADGLDFYSLDNFDFHIVKPDRRIVYTGCSITAIDEEGQLNDIIAENIQIRAVARRED